MSPGVDVTPGNDGRIALFYIKLYKENKIRSVEDLEYKDPKVFWKIIKDLSQNHMELNTSNLISNNEWVNYFSQLFNIYS